MNEAQITLLLSFLALVVNAVLTFSQRKKNLSASGLDGAKAASELNRQTIALLETYKANIAAQEETLRLLEAKVEALEAQAKLLRKEIQIYKSYINYLLAGIKQLIGQLQMLKQPASFKPEDMDTFQDKHDLESEVT